MNLLIPIIASSIISLTTAEQVYNTPIHANNARSSEAYQPLDFQQRGQPRGFTAPQISHNHGRRLQLQVPTNVVQHRGPPPGHHQVAYQESPEKNARILSYDSHHNHHNYQYAYETENGIKAQEAGQVEKGTQAQGAYSYTGDDGHVYSVTYTADEYGFRPQGEHLPTPPPIPEEIAKAIEQNVQQAANGVYDDGSYKPQSKQDYQQYQGISSYKQNGCQQGSYQQNNYQNSQYQTVPQISTGGNSQQNNYQHYQNNQYQNAPQISTGGNSQQNNYQHYQNNQYQNAPQISTSGNFQQYNYQNSQYQNAPQITTSGNSGYHN